MASALIYLLIALMWLIPVILVVVGVTVAIRWSGRRAQKPAESLTLRS
jgi:cytochrome c-type biogenesis protein CcmH/NrfF